ncbi:hypothetical protein [Microvirga lotononidis]|uniref:hypothetical protein n=1 Tax=Microvirga lotononidis TaxID=864069 RepID=UPI0012B55E6D|nr:hypothetical protein [Microvirga lotononidis]WQO27616.1 hypothetical protein U0023_00440 [Microvirga lotononidis]
MSELARLAARRNRLKKLEHFELWNEIYDEYVSWVISVASSIYLPLKNEGEFEGNVELRLSVTMLFFRLVSDLLSVRILCREGHDVAAKVIARTAVENIDLIILLLKKPELAIDFWNAEDTKRSNDFWHKNVKGEKARKVQKDILRVRLNNDDAASSIYDWMYEFHAILGASTHPSQLGAMFSVLAIGSGTTDNWLGMFGDRAEISCDTYSHLVTHIWKIGFYFKGFPFDDENASRLGLKYSEENTLNRHAKVGGETLTSFLVGVWHPERTDLFFKDYDVSNIWPEAE